MIIVRWKKSVTMAFLVCAMMLVMVACGNGEKVKDAIAKGDEALTSKDYTAAIAAYNEALELDSDNETALQQKSSAEAKIKEAENLVEDAKTAIDEGKYDKAIQAFESALEIHPDNEDAPKGIEQAQKNKSFENYISTVSPTLAEVGQFAAAWDELRAMSVNGEITDVDFGTIVYEDALPHAVNLQESFEDISLTIDQEFQETHEIMIQALSSQVQAFSEIVAAIDSGDMSKITSANELLSAARENERKYMQKLKNQATELGIEME